ncbi:hypothetical protein ULMA_02380 [Patiriisocius marinus]|uniref:KTSC domain-containing protein n=1 Tax=Patiriisocius marinus TaxID=1397112 RepID=A0A5J4IWH4_9FLAO|nr:KTSC domain-containing protein [Patiriisocius marinus]GER58130.1 hypothetical protein ULMA_02380 [Patiriisocius marinus]
MKKMLFVLVLVGFVSCNSQNCETLPATYTSYSQAVSKITNATFNFTDSVNTSTSSWITNADFYSCDGTQGYLVLKTTKKNYLFKNVPKQVWHNFKAASSFGKFYNNYIRGKYQLVL